MVEAQPWFAFLDRHHYIHHVDLGANLNFLLPLGRGERARAAAR